MHTDIPTDGFMIGVTVRPPSKPRLTFLEYCADKIGPPARVMKVCDRAQMGLLIWVGFYVLTWTFLIGEAVTDRLSLSPGASLLFSLAWTPVMALQVVFGALRYGAVNLLMRSAQQIASVTHQAFFEQVGACVADSVERFMAQQAPPEKPTLQ